MIPRCLRLIFVTRQKKENVCGGPYIYVCQESQCLGGGENNNYPFSMSVISLAHAPTPSIQKNINSLGSSLDPEWLAADRVQYSFYGTKQCNVGPNLGEMLLM